MAQSQAHLSAGSALGRRAGCWLGSGRSWSWELSWAHGTWPQNPFLPFFPSHRHPPSSRTRPHLLGWQRRAPSQTPKTSVWVRGDSESERKHGTGGLLHFLQNAERQLLPSAQDRSQVRRHTAGPGLTMFCIAFLWAPLLLFKSLTSLDAASRLQALSN